MRRRSVVRVAGRALLGLLVTFSVWLVAIDRPRKVVAPEVQGWNHYHYAVGAGFFAELGYYDLYTATLAADVDGSLAHVTEVRDLRTGKIVDRPATLPSAPAGLNAWVDALQPFESERTWRDLFRDRGYNASPAYTAVLGPLVRAFPPTVPGNPLLLSWIDPALLTLALCVLAAARGVDVAGGLALALFAFPGLWHRQIGGLVEYDWLAALITGLAAASLRWPATAAVAFAWATAARLFPGVMVATMLLPTARRLLSGRKVPPFEARFVPVFGGALLAFVALGATAGRGWAAWTEFAGRIRLHAALHALGEQRVGLRHLWTAFGEPLAGESVQQALLDERRPLFLASAALLVGLPVAAAWRRTRTEAALFGLLAVFALTTTSRYYAAAIVLWPALAPRAGWLWVWLFALVPAGYALWRLDVAPRPTWWLLEAALLGAMVVRAVQVLAGDARAWSRLRRARAAGSGRGQVDHLRSA